MRIDDLLEAIKKEEIALPEFQREHVWTKEQARQLMISLINEYPAGSLLLWETDHPPALKNHHVTNTERSLEQLRLILDGQQRLTTLYLLIKGDVPPYYRESDIEHDPRDLCFHLGTTYFEYHNLHKMSDDPRWCRVVDCFSNRVDVDELGLQMNDGQSDKQLWATNLARLCSIQGHDFQVEITHQQEIDRVIEIFDRVNSYGTALAPADLVLAHVVSKWPEMRLVMKNLKSELASQHFDFDLEFMVRCMIVGLIGSARYADMSVHRLSSTSRGEFMSAWERVDRSLRYLVHILPKEAYVNSLGELPSDYLLMPILAYLIRWGEFDSHKTRKGFWYWMFLASIWRRYAGPFEPRLQRDVYLAVNFTSPVSLLIRQIEEYRGRTRVKAEDLKGHGAGHPLHRILFTMTKWKNAKDWVTDMPLRKQDLDYEELHSQHIFPQSVLYKGLYREEQYADRRRVNEIANRAFLTLEAEYPFAQALPNEYLPRQLSSSLRTQFIPNESSLWELDQYEAFLTRRRGLIAQSINEFLTSFGFHPHGEIAGSDYLGLIQNGESTFVEFKSMLRSDPDQTPSRSLEYQVAKTLAAFMNSGGGVLFIGVMDNGEIRGINQDYALLGNRTNRDGFYLYFTQVVNTYLGKDMNAYVGPKIVDIDGKDVCVVEIAESSRPVYIRHEDERRFYIRAAASSEPLSEREAKSYINGHW